MSRIRIKNFGPIKEGYQEDDGWMDIKKVTVFIGNQGSGKSTVAKLISTLKWTEKRMFKKVMREDALNVNDAFEKQCEYHKLRHYFKADTEIEYIGKAYRFSYKDKVFIVTKIDPREYKLPKILYVPSDRNFVAAIEKVQLIEYLPTYLVAFLEEYERALSNYKSPVALPINKTRLLLISGIPFIQGFDYDIPITSASSGFQASVPLFLVTKNLAQVVNEGSDISKREMSSQAMQKLREDLERILLNDNLAQAVKDESLSVLSSMIKLECLVNIVEEPEQNLFPTSQQQMLNSLLEFNNMNQESQLIMTTHSPYLINYLTLAVKAEMVKSNLNSSNSKEKLAEIVPLEATLKPDDLVIYELDEKIGTIRKLESYKGLPSDENYLNSSLEDSNELFAQIQEIEKGWL